MLTSFGEDDSRGWPFGQRVICHLAKSGHYANHLKLSESFFGMFEVFCNFGILTALVKPRSSSGSTEYHGIGLSSTHT